MKKLVLTFDSNAPKVEAPINDLSRIEITNPSGSMERFDRSLARLVSVELVEDGDA